MYKLIITDLDNTAIDGRPDAEPSQAVIDAVRSAEAGSVHIAAATGRPLHAAIKPIRAMGLTAPCVFYGGSQIIDPSTQKVLWSCDVPESAMELIKQTVRAYNCKLYAGEDHYQTSGKVEEFNPKKKTSIVYVCELDPEDAVELEKILGADERLEVHPAGSWAKGKQDLQITDRQGTKEHGLQELIRIMKLDKSEVVAVGDAGNDRPLFQAAGLKIAVGNATNELKSMADIVVPNCLDDGFAEAVNLVMKQNHKAT
jgi:HAD superfamily hydrolase (TIGR01484 family)